MEYIMLIAGLVLLFVSGDFLIKGGVSLAKHLKVSTLVIGLTVVSMGTSLPELFVSAEAAIKGFPEMALGNVIGSNIANIALVLALTVIIFPMPVKNSTMKFDTPFMVISSLLMFFFLFDNRISRLEGLLFLGILTFYVIYTFRKQNDLGTERKVEKVSPKYPVWLCIVIILLSSVGLKFGAEWLVRGAVFIASKFNVSETVISVTMVAFGTSVPELATSIIAAFKKEPDISVGNIVGSNIFNILGVLGITALLKSIAVSDPMVRGFHLYWMLAVAILLNILILSLFKTRMGRIKGAFLLGMYIVYIWLTIH